MNEKEVKVIKEAINELKATQKWLDNYKFDGYYPYLGYLIDKLENLINELNEFNDYIKKEKSDK